MNKTQRFMVEIVSSQSMPNNYTIDEMSQRIANSIVNGARDFGIMPDGSDAVAEIVYVKGWYSDKQIIEHV
jgi:hypothetical protein